MSESFWVVTASADHAARGKVEGIVQANHGKPAALRRMSPGDGVVIYSPRTTYPAGAPLQAFTLIGRVADGAPVPLQMAGMVMWRRPVLWQSTAWAPIRPLLDDLDLTRGQASWGMVFRYGLTRLTRPDFARAMTARSANQLVNKDLP